MTSICSLYSGSSGNSTYIGGESGGILVDMGKSCRQTLQQMARREIDPAGLLGVFITHEHIDHVRGLKVFLKNRPVPLYASPATAAALRQKDALPPEVEVRYIDESCPARLPGFSVEAMATSHDCEGSQGSIGTTDEGRKITVATDMGVLPDRFYERVEGSDAVLIESNYDEDMLRACGYPYYLKRRIISESGHLSNDCCADAVEELTRRGVSRFLLAHLSINSNFPGLAFETSAAKLRQMGALVGAGQDVMLEVMPRDEASLLWAF